MQNGQLGNLLVVCGEAQTFTTHYLRDESVDGVFVNFPDPWPKTKHAKHRLIQQPFVRELARTLKSGGEVTLATDDLAYATQMIEEIGGDPAFTAKFPAPHFVTTWPGYGASYFDSLWRAKSRTIHYIAFRKGA
jgi:tRNA (guanine-N7-)-methyltransferase